MQLLLFLGGLCLAAAREIHVATTGDDATGDGSPDHPYKTIQFGATQALSGDTVTVHAGMYRERVQPPRGSVTYQAAPGEAVTISGAEPASSGWARAGASNSTWMLVLPSSSFGNFNPYSDRIRGDWFGDNGLVHHTGTVYLGADWLGEAASLADVLKPLAPGAPPQWFPTVDGDAGQYLVNLLWLRPRGGGAVSAGLPSWRYGTKPYNSTQGPCAAFILNGDVLRFDGVDFTLLKSRKKTTLPAPRLAPGAPLFLPAQGGTASGSGSGSGCPPPEQQLLQLRGGVLPPCPHWRCGGRRCHSHRLPRGPHGQSAHGGSHGGRWALLAQS